MPTPTDTVTDEPTEEVARTEKTFGGLSPSEAAKKRWRDAKAADSEIAERATGEILVPVDDAAIYKALRLKAEKGDVQAARLILERPRASRPDVLALLTKEQRAQVRVWLEGEIAGK